MKLWFGSATAANDTTKTLGPAMRALALGGTLLGLAVASGCSTSTATPSHGMADAAPDAVTVDAYESGKKVSACAGTLLSQNVVLTAAHCASGTNAIRVRAPNAAGQSAEVARVLFYDWGFGKGHAGEHDVALLLLRSDIHAASYARVDDSAALRAQVTVGGRFISAGHAAASTSMPVAVAPTTPAGRPFALTVQTPALGAAAGGAVKRSDGSLVGVYMGEGDKSGTGYFARLDDGNVMRWMRGVVGAKGSTLSLAPYAGSTLKAASISGSTLRNTGGSGGTGGASGDGTAANDNGSGAPSEDVKDPATDDGQTEDGEGAPANEDEGGQPVSANSPTAQVSSGPNHWAAFEKDDPAAAGDPDKAYAEAHPDIAEVGSHGAPGYMENRPDAATLKMIAKDKDGMVVAACYAGANPEGGGQSTAASLAADSGLSPDKVYGCTGTMSLGSSADCNGTWVDGNGKAVSADVMKKYNLKNAA